MASFRGYQDCVQRHQKVSRKSTESPRTTVNEGLSGGILFPPDEFTRLIGLARVTWSIWCANWWSWFQVGHGSRKT